MSRTISAAMQTALGVSHGYKPIVRAEIYPSLISFGTLTRDNAITGADTVPAADDPMRQDIIYNATAGLTTFYSDGSLKYALDEDSSPVTTVYSSSIKPGLYGSKVFVAIGSDVKRFSIDWDKIAAKNTDPLTLEQTLTPTKTTVVVHAVSESDCVLLGNDDGGLSVTYYDGTTEIVCPYRFIFPSSVEWDGYETRDMESLGIFSTGFQLGNRTYIYASNASSGTVQGIFYDADTETWSDFFTALPTDIEVSLCEFRISNSFVRNSRGYIVGQLIRSDIYESDQPYTLILSTSDGVYFSIDRFSFVSNLGYRFLGTVGSDNNLYLANSNRVCEAPSTWVFDGDDDSTSPYTEIAIEDILNVSFSSDRMSISLAFGDEAILSNSHFAEGSRVKLFTGYATASGEEDILFDTYIVQEESFSFRDGDRSYSASCIHEGQWKLSGLSMPFYAEIMGLSTLFDPMTEESGKLYSAQSDITETSFWVDFWNHEGYANSGEGINADTSILGGGVDVFAPSGSHKIGFKTKHEVSYLIGSNNNPKITGTELTVKVYGWSHPATTGTNDSVNLILITCDEDGKNEETEITTGTRRWKSTWGTAAAGTDPIVITLSGQTVGRYIKYVGLVFENSVSTVSCPGRVEFTNNVELTKSLSSTTAPWERLGDGTFKVPVAGQPFIMFAQRPYNAWNFFLTTLFENTVTGGITGYPVAAGLIGLAEDSSNYILARYDKVADEIQLLVYRDGLETELAAASPGFSVGDLNGMQFSHQDGHFEVKLYDEALETYSTVLTYDWGASDGFLYTSRTVTKKCGIWGGILVPSVNILAYDGSAQESATVSDGIAIDPMGDITDFPSSGSLSIGDNIYTYSGKVTPASIVHGPHQLRNTGTYGGGGLECLYFEWTATPSAFANKFVALDNGKNFIISSSEWQISWEGSYRTNRSRHYSDNPQIVGSSSTISTRVFVGAGGFSGVSLSSGSPRRFSIGDRALLHLSGTIKCYWFMGAGGEHDTTVRDLIRRSCILCGTNATFPGDVVTPTLSVTGEETISEDEYAEGFDLEFDLDAPADFEIRTNVRITPDNYDNSDEIESDTGTKLVFEYLDYGGFSISLVSTPSGTVMYTFIYSGNTAAQHYRILYYSDNISVYHNYRWVASIATDGLEYTQTSTVDVVAYSATELVFDNVTVRDLKDWREAVYIDLETDGMSALSSIIQERPVEIIPNPDGTLAFYYDRVRPEVTLLTEPYSHDHQKSIPRDGASDAIVYGLKDTKTIVYKLFAETFGFATKLFRLPNLDSGAIESAYRLLIRAYESKDNHRLSGRPDFRIVEGDVVNFSYTISGTERYYNQATIVESVSYAISQGDKSMRAEMTLTGRGYLT